MSPRQDGRYSQVTPRPATVCAVVTPLLPADLPAYLAMLSEIATGRNSK